MTNFIHQFHFIRPWWWLAFIPLILLTMLYKNQAHTDNQWQKVCDAHLLPHLLVDKFKQSSNRWLWLLALAWFVAIFSLSGPTWRYEKQPVYQKQISRVIVMDLSTNTLATDLPPSRLAREKFKLLDLLNHLKEGQVGLIVYAGEPYTVSPLTNDAKTISAMVSDLSPQIIPVQGNNLSSGLLLAKKLFQQAEVTQGQVIVLSSGHIDEQAIKTSKQLSASGFNVSVLGIGSSKQAPLSAGDGQYMHTSQGNIAFSQYNAKQLQQLAKAGHGTYLPISDSNQDITQLLAFDKKASITNRSREHRQTKLWQDEGHWFVFLLLPFVLLCFRRKFLTRI